MDVIVESYIALIKCPSISFNQIFRKELLSFILIQKIFCYFLRLQHGASYPPFYVFLQPHSDKKNIAILSLLTFPHFRHERARFLLNKYYTIFLSLIQQQMYTCFFLNFVLY